MSTKCTPFIITTFIITLNDRFIVYLQSIAEELIVEELVDDQDLAEDDEEVGGLAGVEQHRIAVILVVEMLLRQGMLK